MTDLAEQLDAIFERLKPLYRLLHAYVRRKLTDLYPNYITEKIGPLPAHLLGDMWAQQWHNIFEDIKPYKNKPLLDVTDNMLAKVRYNLGFIRKCSRVNFNYSFYVFMFVLRT